MSNIDFSLLSVFTFSFLAALTGAMSPGPLLTYTIIKSVKTRQRGYLMGAWIILGHAVIEMAIILAMLFGFSFIFKNIALMRAIGLGGGLILVLFGVSVIKNVYFGTIPTHFLSTPENETDNQADKELGGLDNPVIGGALVSMSNPYWWVWWATIGFAFMIQFDISFRDWPKLIAFFLGHEAGDLVWYLLISCMAFFGMRHLNKKIYYGILVLCGVFMILFGVYLGGSLFFKTNVAFS